MKNYIMTEAELRLTEIVWENESISSGELVIICLSRFEWKKSTTYTVLKKLCNKKILWNNNSTVSPLVNKTEYDQLKSERFIDENFEGSLPGFLVAFMNGRKLNKQQVDEIKKLIDEYDKGGDTTD